MTMQVLSVREKTDISQCLEKPAQLNLSKHHRKQAYSVGASTGRPGRLKFLRCKLKYSERTCTMWLQTILNSNILFSR